MKTPSALVSCRYESPLGPMLLAATDTGVAGVWFEGQRHGPDSTGWPDQPDHPMLRRAREQLADYFAGQRDSFDLPLDLRLGTAFQQSVWQALLRIPRGETTSYGELSRRVG